MTATLVSTATGAELLTARDVVDTLANKRRDLFAAKQLHGRATLELGEIKGRVIQTLILEKNGELGKTESDKARTIDIALSDDRAYQTALVGVQQAKETVDGLAVEVEIFADYFSLARLEARVALAQAIQGSGMRVEDV